MSSQHGSNKDEQRYHLSKEHFATKPAELGRRSTATQPKFLGTLGDAESMISVCSSGKASNNKKPTLILLKCLDESASRCGEGFQKRQSRGFGSSTTAIEKKNSGKRSSVASSIRLASKPGERSLSPGFLFKEQAGSTKSVQLKPNPPAFLYNLQQAEGRRPPFNSLEKDSSIFQEAPSPTHTKSESPVQIQPFFIKKARENAKGPKLPIAMKLNPKTCFDESTSFIKQPKVLFGSPESFQPPVCKRIQNQESTMPVISFDTLRKESKTSGVIRSSSRTSTFKKTDGLVADIGKGTEQMKSSIFKSLKSKHLSGTESKLFSEDLCNDDQSDCSYD